MRWLDISNSNPFSEVDYFLGFDSEAFKEITEVENHLTNVLGKPTLRKTDSDDEFEIKWLFKKAHISIITWERFAIHGMLYIGLNHNINNEI
jgi:hypothetical protein